MANSRFTKIYKILKDYNFASENEISSDFLCTICNKILINAHNSPCGCRYCLECITAYLHGEDKCCPGSTDDCKIELLNINNNILTDQPMNIKISKLLVKCPEVQCNEKVEMRKLEDHIRVCDWRPTDCPFFNVGCRNVQMSNDKMEQHILSENHEHTKLLMDCIDILRSEFGEMREEMRETKAEVREIRKIKVDMKDWREEMNEMKEEIRVIKTEVIEMREEIRVIQVVIDELRAVIAQKSGEIDLLGEEIVAFGNANRRLQDQINGLGTKIENCEAANLEMRNVEKQMSQLRAQINDIFEQIKMNTVNVDIDGTEKVVAIESKQDQLNHGEFVWLIGNFYEKIQEARNCISTQIFSDAFFSHKDGYKMCLSVWPNGNAACKGTHLSVFMHSICGPFDDILQWPCKCDVTFAIINQQTGLNHISYTLKYEDLPDDEYWRRPTIGRNRGCGYPNFIELNQLLNDIALYRDDIILIKCTVKIC